MKRYRLRERQHPIFSPVAMISALIFMLSLTAGIYFKGGSAFSPGDLSALPNSGASLGGFNSHLAFQEDCSQCHEPFHGISAELCERCHQQIKQQREVGTGIHSQIDLVEQCGRCHRDHLGAEADLLLSSLPFFNHNVTSFSLARHSFDYQGAAIKCAGCHQSDGGIELRPDACRQCHQAEQPKFIDLHTTAYGTVCIDCHDGKDTAASFSLSDHQLIFPLDGAHSEVKCESCHQNGDFTDLPQDCGGCHLEPPVHKGFFNNDCAGCHTTPAWKPAVLDGSSFDHASARFGLIGHEAGFDGGVIRCDSCHAAADLSFNPNACLDCHTPAQPEFMPQHLDAVGAACFNCHQGNGNTREFDHAAVWPLQGKHQNIACLDCHQQPRSDSEPRECETCHLEPQIHFGAFGTDCAACHVADGWLPAQLIRHDFPLNHGEGGDVACVTCHETVYVEYTCYGCHEHDPIEIADKHQGEGIIMPELAACVSCHPTGTEADIKDD